MVDVPRKITPCPIKEAVFEVRFNPALPEDAVFGVLYTFFKKEFTKFETLPIMQLPNSIRAQDNNLKYAPHYRCSVGNFILQIGPRVVSFININEYVGWDVFYTKIEEVASKINESNVASELERIALRYINSFPDLNIYEKSNFHIALEEAPLSPNKLNITTIIKDDIGFRRLAVANDATFETKGREGSGSIIDIDSVVTLNSDSSLKEAIIYAHQKEKELFFKILDKEFLKGFDPEY